MKVKFVNGTIKKCAAPMEQKLFKSAEGNTIGVGWMLNLRLIGEITSDELDDILTDENISRLEFITDGEEGEISLFTLNDYEKVSASTIRYSEDATATFAEIQMSKGV